MSKHKCRNCERCTQSIAKQLFQFLTGLNVIVATKDALSVTARKCPECKHLLKFHTEGFNYQGKKNA